MTSEVVFTTEVKTFLDSLRPGDVLLFDSIHPLSHLIKLAENRPVNHSAIYLGDDKYAHVTQHDPPKVDGGNTQGPSIGDNAAGAPSAVATDIPAAREENLRDRLLATEGRPDRTVTALRHDKWTAARASAVVTRARSYTDPKDTTYSYLGLFGLMIPSLLRTYEDYFTSETMLKAFAGTMKALAQSIVSVFEGDAGRVGHGKGRTLTCSEFVYRCFNEADKDMRLNVTRPLGRWPEPAQLHSGPDTDTGNKSQIASIWAPQSFSFVPSNSGALSGEGLVVFDQSFRADILGPYLGLSHAPEYEMLPLFSDDTSDTPTAIPHFEQAQFLSARKIVIGLTDIAEFSSSMILGALRANRDRKKYDDAKAQQGDPLEDLITPRDLWSSDSLVTKAVLHRPPTPDEAGLDQPHGHPGDD